jgi:acetylglutamate kinase
MSIRFISSPIPSSPSSLDQALGKAGVLVEALPYIQRFSGKTVLVKYGGSLMNDEAIERMIIQDLAMMKHVGIRPVLVHGGGPAMNTLLGQLRKDIRFVRGYRVTDEETLTVAEMVLSGKINKTLVAALQNHGVRAVGLSGQDGRMITVKKREIDGVDMGFEGEVSAINTELLHTLMNESFLPVISPIGMDSGGQAYNMNGDVVAVALATALNAEKLIFLTDVPGVLQVPDDPLSRWSVLDADQARALVANGQVLDGMAAKVASCVEAVEQGVHSVHILDGRVPHALLLEIFTEEGLGTMVVAQNQLEQHPKESLS